MVVALVAVRAPVASGALRLQTCRVAVAAAAAAAEAAITPLAWYLRLRFLPTMPAVSLTASPPRNRRDSHHLPRSRQHTYDQILQERLCDRSPDLCPRRHRGGSCAQRTKGA